MKLRKLTWRPPLASFEPSPVESGVDLETLEHQATLAVDEPTPTATFSRLNLPRKSQKKRDDRKDAIAEDHLAAAVISSNRIIESLQAKCRPVPDERHQFMSFFWDRLRLMSDERFWELVPIITSLVMPAEVLHSMPIPAPTGPRPQSAPPAFGPQVSPSFQPSYRTFEPPVQPQFQAPSYQVHTSFATPRHEHQQPTTIHSQQQQQQTPQQRHQHTSQQTPPSQDTSLTTLISQAIAGPIGDGHFNLSEYTRTPEAVGVLPPNTSSNRPSTGSQKEDGQRSFE